MSRARGMVALVFVAAAACGGEDFQSGDGASGGASSASGGGGSSASGMAGSTSTGQGAAGGGGSECPSGSACVPVAPEGWEPVAVHLGPQPLDDCPQPWTDKTTGNVGEPEPSHTCSDCACGAAANVKCSFPTIEVSTGGCSFGEPIVTTLTSEGCKSVGGGYNSKITIITPSGGTCPSSGGLPSKSDPIWPAVATLCAPASAPTACSTGVCSPVDEPFSAKVCIQQEGNVGCPDAFTDRVVAYRGFMDDRACEQCACSSPAGASCDGKLTIYSSQNCTGLSYVPPNDGACHLFDYTAGVLFDSDATGGACTATGGASKGGIHNADPVTVCCRPLE